MFNEETSSEPKQEKPRVELKSIGIPNYQGEPYGLMVRYSLKEEGRFNWNANAYSVRCVAVPEDERLEKDSLQLRVEEHREGTESETYRVVKDNVRTIEEANNMIVYGAMSAYERFLENLTPKGSFSLGEEWLKEFRTVLGERALANLIRNIPADNF
ncbi:MAG: hypothetical protein ABIF88_03665 [archaeon]